MRAWPSGAPQLNFKVLDSDTASVQGEFVGYYMRFVSTDARDITATELRDALLAVEPGYEVLVDDTVATILHDGATIAHVEINVPGDGLFDQECEDWWSS